MYESYVDKKLCTHSACELCSALCVLLVSSKTCSCDRLFLCSALCVLLVSKKQIKTCSCDRIFVYSGLYVLFVSNKDVALISYLCAAEKYLNGLNNVQYFRVTLVEVEVFVLCSLPSKTQTSAAGYGSRLKYMRVLL